MKQYEQYCLKVSYIAKKLDVMNASWVREVTEILTQRNTEDDSLV